MIATRCFSSANCCKYWIFFRLQFWQSPALFAFQLGRVHRDFARREHVSLCYVLLSEVARVATQLRSAIFLVDTRVVRV